jgi:hypothetical protein
MVLVSLNKCRATVLDRFRRGLPRSTGSFGFRISLLFVVSNGIASVGRKATAGSLTILSRLSKLEHSLREHSSRSRRLHC